MWQEQTREREDAESRREGAEVSEGEEETSRGAKRRRGGDRILGGEKREGPEYSGVEQTGLVDVAIEEGRDEKPQRFRLPSPDRLARDGSTSRPGH